MPTVERASLLLGELADFLATSPTKKEVLAFRPSTRVQKRYRVLLAKHTRGDLEFAEEYELNQYEQLEMLMQRLKARIQLSLKQSK